MAETMTKWKFFTLCDYEKEEAFLTRMHQQGWKLVSFGIGCYTFERCEPAQYAYRIDFAAEYTNKEEYLQMFRDYGWEYLGELNDFTYFRQNADNLTEAETEIFSDNESRFQMMSKVLRWKMLPILVIFFLCMCPIILRVFSGEIHSLSVCGAYGFLVLLYLILFLYNFIGFSRLKNKYKNKK